MIASDALTGEPARLLDASAVEVDHVAGALHVLCPAGTTFDAAEALRLQLVDRAPPGAVVDVEIAPSEPGTLSPEDEAGARLFVELRAERLAGAGTCGTPGCCPPKDVEPGANDLTGETDPRSAREIVGEAVAVRLRAFPTPRELSGWTTVPLAAAFDALADHSAIETSGEEVRGAPGALASSGTERVRATLQAIANEHATALGVPGPTVEVVPSYPSLALPCEFCGRKPCGCVVVSDGARYVPGCEPGDRERLLEHVAAIEAKLGSAVNAEDEGDAFPWDEPEGGAS